MIDITSAEAPMYDAVNAIDGAARHTGEREALKLPWGATDPWNGARIR
jgi:hypothetical protein